MVTKTPNRHGLGAKILPKTYFLIENSVSVSRPTWKGFYISSRPEANQNSDFLRLALVFDDGINSVTGVATVIQHNMKYN